MFLKNYSKNSINRNVWLSKPKLSNGWSRCTSRAPVPCHVARTEDPYIAGPLSPTKVRLKLTLKVEYFAPEKCLSQRLKENCRRQSEFPVGFSTENDFGVFNEIWLCRSTVTVRQL